jgi:hypothetical protein
MKLCKDCEYCDDRKCKHELAKGTQSVLDGSVDFNYCTIMRLPSQPCQPEAIMFKQKTSISNKLKAKAEQLFGKYWS